MPVSASIVLGEPANNIVVADDRVWVGSSDAITPVDPRTNAVGTRIEVPNVAGFFAFGFDSAWVSDYDASIVRRVDLGTGEVIAEIAVGDSPEGIAFSEDSVWVANHHGGSLTRIDPATNTVVTTLEVAPPGVGGPQHVVEAGGILWVTVPNKHAVLTLDPTANVVLAEIVTTGDPCGEIALVDSKAWVAGCDNQVYVIDARTNEEVGVVELRGQPGAAFDLDDRVWLPEAGSDGARSGQIVAIGPSLTMEDAVEVEPAEFSAVPGFDSVWVVDAQDAVLVRLDAAAVIGAE